MRPALKESMKTQTTMTYHLDIGNDAQSIVTHSIESVSDRGAKQIARRAVKEAIAYHGPHRALVGRLYRVVDGEPCSVPIWRS